MKQDFRAFRRAVEVNVKNNFRQTGQISPGMAVDVVGWNPDKPSTVRVRYENGECDFGFIHLDPSPSDSKFITGEIKRIQTEVDEEKKRAQGAELPLATSATAH